jgi:hypothetical protein
MSGPHSGELRLHEHCKISDGQHRFIRILTNPATRLIVAGIVRFQMDDVVWPAFWRTAATGISYTSEAAPGSTLTLNDSPHFLQPNASNFAWIAGPQIFSKQFQRQPAVVADLPQ